MKSRVLSVICACICSIFPYSNAESAPILDQEFDPMPGSGLVYIPTLDFFHAQVFTVGTTGTLASVELLLFGDTNNAYEIFQAVVGEPDTPSNWYNTPIGSSSLGFFELTSTGNALNWWGADLSGLNIDVTAGDKLAIIKRAGGGSGYWVGTDDPNLVFLHPDKHYHTLSSEWTVQPSVLGYRTYVEAVPISGTIWLFGSGLLVLTTISIRRRSEQ